jgi:endonuclease YncB( thermonuclease family)
MPLFRVVLAAIGLALVSAPAGADLSSWARVLDDGSLSVGGTHVRLQGVSIPPTDRLCNQPDMPATCAPRAVLQLVRKVGAEFVRCQDLGRDAGNAMLGRCSVLGEDLGGWMILNGWAMAGQEAPFEYVQWERLAERRGLGIWGRPVDNIIVRPAPRPRPAPPAKPGS